MRVLHSYDWRFLVLCIHTAIVQLSSRSSGWWFNKCLASSAWYQFLGSPRFDMLAADVYKGIGDAGVLVRTLSATS